jgi:tellurium resistance protein TerD
MSDEDNTAPPDAPDNGEASVQDGAGDAKAGHNPPQTEPSGSVDPGTRQAAEKYEGQFKTLEQGEEIDLTKNDPALQRIVVALGWDVIGYEKPEPDLDASIFLLNKDEQTRQDSDFVFYNNMTGCDGAVVHQGDSRTGAGDGDDETIVIDLNGIPFDIGKVEFVVSIYDAHDRGHSFDNVRNVFARIVNRDTNQELVRYYLDDNIAGKEAEALKVGHLQREGPNWLFFANSEGVKGGLARIARDYGIIVAEHTSTGD